MSVVIEILRGFPDGRLKLSDNGRSDVFEDSSIRWIINNVPEPGSLKVSFFNIQIKEESNDEIFSENPVKDKKEWKAKIKKRGVVDKMCKYGIFWEDENGGNHYFDPIIAVKPTPPRGGNDSISKILIGAVAALIAFVSIKFLLNQQAKRAQ